MNKNSIMVHLGDEAPISDNLRSALENLIEAVEQSGMSEEAEVEGFAQTGARGIKIGDLRPIRPGPIVEKPASEFGCIGFEWTEETGDTCWIMW